MNLQAGKGMFVTLCILALLLLFDGATSREVTGEGGPAETFSGGSNNEGRGFRARAGRSSSSTTTTATSRIPEPVHLGAHQSKATGVYLIPDGRSNIVLPIYPHPQEVKSYYKREGTGMSAWGILAVILGVIGGGTVAWFCYMVGLPMWRDRRRRHSLMSESMRRPGHEGIPLQETPSTATPSPCLAVCLPS